MPMRFNLGSKIVLSSCAIFMLSGCDDAPTYTGPALPAGYKKYEKAPNPVVALNTSAGKITLELFEDETPTTVTNFIELIEKKFYDGKTFHRIVKDFMIQGGDPNGDGSGNPGYKFNDEIDTANNKNNPYSLAMANSGPNTNGSQFFIVTNPKGSHHLDSKHTVFGKVLEGKDIVDKLNLLEVLPNSDKPKDPPKIESATVISKRKHAYKLEESDKLPISPVGTNFGKDGSLQLGPGSYQGDQIQKMLQKANQSNTTPGAK